MITLYDPLPFFISFASFLHFHNESTIFLSLDLLLYCIFLLSYLYCITRLLPSRVFHLHYLLSLEMGQFGPIA